MHKIADADIRFIAHEIRRYIEVRPNARDTLQGIAKWWLSRQRLEESMDDVKKALDYLVEKGIVKEIVTFKHQTIYAKCESADSSD